MNKSFTNHNTPDMQFINSPKYIRKSKINIFIIRVLPIRSQKALNDFQMIIFDQDMAQNVF